MIYNTAVKVGSDSFLFQVIKTFGSLPIHHEAVSNAEQAAVAPNMM
jgi:hypothetical protein